MTIRQELLDELKDRQRRVRKGGGDERHAARFQKGMLSARERLDLFYDEHTFQEWGMHVDHDCHEFGMAKKSLPCDGVVTGIGRVNSRPVAAFSQDATVGGGALGSMGDPVEMVVAGRLIRLCCDGCEPKIKSDPLKYITMVDAAWNERGRFMPEHNDAHGRDHADHDGHDR